MRIRGILARVIAVTVGILLAALIAEAGVRVFSPRRTGPVEQVSDPRMGSIPVPKAHGTIRWPGVFTYTYTNDARGMRLAGLVDRETALARVLVLGDSFTYGIGVNDNQTFTYRLEERFLHAGSAIAVMNGGNAGKGTSYALRFLETIAPDLNPDLVVLAFFPNDFRDNVRPYVYRIGPDGALSVNPAAGTISRGTLSRSRLYNWLISRSQLANAVKQAAIRVIRTRISENEEEDLIFYPEEGQHLTKEAVRTTRIYLNALARRAQAMGLPVLVAYLPRAEDVRLYRRSHLRSPEEKTLGGLLPSGVQFLSLTATMAESPSPVEALYSDEGRTGFHNGHWTAVAHDMAAGALHDPIYRMLRAQMPGLP